MVQHIHYFLFLFLLAFSKLPSVSLLISQYSLRVVLQFLCAFEISEDRIICNSQHKNCLFFSFFFLFYFVFFHRVTCSCYYLSLFLCIEIHIYKYVFLFIGCNNYTEKYSSVYLLINIYIYIQWHDVRCWTDSEMTSPTCYSTSGRK